VNKQEILNQIEELNNQLKALEETENFPQITKIPNRSYEIGVSQVTVKQFRYYCEQTGKEMPRQPNWSTDDHPVVNITWYEARKYCDWLTEVTGQHYDLPTEDEWEYCCADHKEANPEIAVYNVDQPEPVMSKKPNKFGLYDMLGNVWEWTTSPYTS
jgi:formylglycine-generating enzyme required for sulfatase activity